MSAADISNDLLESFAPLVRDEAHLTFVLGAGASAPSGLPMWDEFARRVALSSGLVDSETAAGLLLSRQDPALVLEGAHAAAGDRWEDLLVEALYRGEFDPVPCSSRAHRTGTRIFGSGSIGSGPTRAGPPMPRSSRLCARDWG